MRWLVLLALDLLLLGCLTQAPAGEKVKSLPPSKPQASPPKPVSPAPAPQAQLPPAPAPEPQPAPAPRPSPGPDSQPQPPEELAPPASAEQCEKDSRYAENKAACYASLPGVPKDALHRAPVPQN